MKNLLYLFLATIIFGCSNSSTSNSNTLHLENNGMTLSFDEDGLKVSNENGESIVFTNDGLKLFNPQVMGELRVFNLEGKPLARIYERDYPTRGKGGELAINYNEQNRYTEVNTVGSMDIHEKWAFDNMKLLSNAINNSAQKTKNLSNSVGKVCLDCYGKGYRRPGGTGDIISCYACKGTGRVSN